MVQHQEQTYTEQLTVVDSRAEYIQHFVMPQGTAVDLHLVDEPSKVLGETWQKTAVWLRYELEASEPQKLLSSPRDHFLSQLGQ